MKKRILIIFILIISLTLLLVACGETDAGDTPLVDTPIVEPSDENGTPTVDDEDGVNPPIEEPSDDSADDTEDDSEETLPTATPSEVLGAIANVVPEKFTFSIYQALANTVFVKDGNKLDITYFDPDTLEVISRYVYVFGENNVLDNKYNLQTNTVTCHYGNETMQDYFVEYITPFGYIKNLLDEFVYENGEYKLNATNVPIDANVNVVYTYSQFNVRIELVNGVLKNASGNAISEIASPSSWTFEVGKGVVAIPENAPKFANEAQKALFESEIDYSKHSNLPLR